MKLEKYVDKKQKRRKEILISISVIVLISVSLLLYKTFASFTESAEFSIMNGKVDYFGNSDVYFAFYKGDDEQLDTMPVKDNAEGLVFDHAECDNGANVEWNSEEWGPVVKNLRKSKTKCSLYFDKLGEVELYGKKIPLVNSGNGLYKVEHNDIIDEMTEYRYAGSNPNNYISVDDGIWRIIGLVNIQTEYGAEQRIKIIRTKGIEGQQDLGDYSWDYKSSYNNDWTTSTLNTMLNGI